MQQKLMRYMPLMFMVFLYNYSAALTLYWTVQNLLTIAQTKLTKNIQATPAPPGPPAKPTPAAKGPVLTPPKKNNKLTFSSIDQPSINNYFLMPAEPKATLEKLLELLGFPVTVEEHRMEDGVLLDVKTDDSGRLIGRQGLTLSDLQYITNRLLFQQDPSVPKVMVDVSGYRAQARGGLVKKAKDAAEKVRRCGHVVGLE